MILGDLQQSYSESNSKLHTKNTVCYKAGYRIEYSTSYLKLNSIHHTEYTVSNRVSLYMSQSYSEINSKLYTENTVCNYPIN